MAVVPLPSLGRCLQCDREQPIRRDGLVRQHSRCPGGGLPPSEVLRPTFARWLWMHRHRDGHVGQLAELCFIGCTYGTTRYSAARQASDVEWQTADELHESLHPAAKSTCSWLCDFVDQARKGYEQAVREAP